ncbi:MAG: N-acylneuraminate cytidylyltransferase [Bacteroidales bacterium]|nr:N-acylneuraminate cytidylyltransferase [Bacteroidales bacterium]
MEKVVAFIPVRGGSKSIPLKNIKPFCGKPLVCWNIEALERCLEVDQIVVATDSDIIEDVVVSQHYPKTKVYRRSAENASDTSSTESVMLEYIHYADLDDNIVFMLVQATSPLTQTNHFTEALELYKERNYDSMLSCVRNKRFFWNENGESVNYDYKKRPRRQEFAGLLMENGAFYINKVKNILEKGNRLSGRIGIYEMPEYTANEIDEPEDWFYLEDLMRRRILANCQKNIKLFLSDVDGVLTDAGMYYSENGDELKKFNTHDGMGFRLLRNAGIKTGIITTENTKIVENRARKLNVDYLYQGKREGGKLGVAKEICVKEGISLNEVAYIGDDINCYDLLSAVGIAACPANAVLQIKRIPGIILLKKRGGEGAVREFVEWLLCPDYEHSK